MLEINKNKLVPGIVATWGDITGNISNQSDLVEYINSHGGGKAEWGSISGNISDQSDLMSTLGSYATESWVSDQGYLTEHQSLKTINGESIVGSGNIEVGGLTPEQEDAVEILTDSSKGVLYTDQLDQYEVVKRSNINFSDINNIYQVGDDVYYFYSGYLLKFNNDTAALEDIANLGQSYSGLWKDSTGRLYQTSQYQIDIENSTFISVDTERMTFYDANGRTNTLNGQYGTWSISDYLQKFDESTQKFVSGYTLNKPEGYESFDFASTFALGGFKYNGHILAQNGSVTFEFKEYEDHIDVLVVTGQYFTVPSSVYKIFATDSGLFNFGDAPSSFYKYNETTETWDNIQLSIDDYFQQRYCVSGDFLIGGFYMESGFYAVTNLGDDWKATSWTDVKNVAVDLSSNQRIKGQKTFTDGITSSGVSVGSSYLSDGYIRLGIQKNIINVEKDLNITVPGLCTLNNKTIAVTDQCILNRSYSYPGPRFKSVAAISGMNAEFNYYFVTPSGRLIYCDETRAYEFNGTQWVQLQTVTNFVASDWRAELSDGLYVVDQFDNKLYKWDDTNSDWVFIIQAPASEIWAADANTLRCNDSYKLVNNGGTYEWVQDSVNNYGFQKSYKLGQTYYYANNNMVYTYDESLKTFTDIGNTQWGDGGHKFVFNGCLYYFNNNNVMKVDPSHVGTDQWDVQTNIYYTSWNFVYVEYGNKIWTVDNTIGQFGYTYDITESVPEVPASDGTYVLKATVLNGQVTFSWVVDEEVAQAVQITNEILG